MSYKRPFDDVMREFSANFPDEVDKLSPEEIAERTGYTLNTVREYFNHRLSIREWRKQEQEIAQRQALEANSYTYVTSSGNVHVVYYPVIGEVKITNKHRQNVRKYTWQEEEGVFTLSPEDAIEVGTYLLGLRPHIQSVLARKEQAVPSVGLTEEPEIAPEPEADNPEEDL